MPVGGFTQKGLLHGKIYDEVLMMWKYLGTVGINYSVTINFFVRLSRY